MIKIAAIAIAIISIIASFVSLLLFTAYWDTIGWLGLWIYAGVMIAIFASWILVVGWVGKERSPLKTMDFAIIAMFGALFETVDLSAMFVPGLSILWYSAPIIAGPLLAFFPYGIVLAAALKLSPKPGTAFTVFLVYFILAQVFFFNPLWLPEGIMLALGLEAYYISSKRGTTSSLVLMGIMFGIMFSISSTIFEIYIWGFWQPLFTTLPKAILCGITMAIGAFLGSAIGERAKTVMY
jgi:hypothetical protein